ncbi:OLC1v1018853C1 [Oldenlandia corymbosa var. corymbosa]|uniref:OLC1v1018853C1 n=1 Tax=Oldenlandia corymbosa var. corymbosa TaxID=529605 RepID=A0AAV1ECN5_OLDCO|nr:OLC1v1018853C1 [Oldenlandia corymbosa var. corymbosa]
MGIAIPKVVVGGELLKGQLKGLQQTVTKAMTNGVSTIIIILNLVPPQDTGIQNNACRKKRSQRKKGHGHVFSHNEVVNSPGERMEWKKVLSPMSSAVLVGTDIFEGVPKPKASIPMTHSEQEILMDYTIAINTLNPEDKPTLKDAEAQCINMAGDGQNALLKEDSTSLLYEADAHQWWQGRKIFTSNRSTAFGFMNVLSWNCRGKNNASSKHVLGLTGGLGLFWIDGVRLSVLMQNSNVIVVKVCEATGVEWLDIYLYGLPSRQGRTEFWNQLSDTIRGLNYPSVILGDFNQVVNQDDKFGGRQVRDQDTKGLQHFLSQNDLEELKHSGR